MKTFYKLLDWLILAVIIAIYLLIEWLFPERTGAIQLIAVLAVIAAYLLIEHFSRNRKNS